MLKGAPPITHICLKLADMDYEFISGKFFCDGKEIDFNKSLYMNPKIAPFLASCEDVEKIRNTFIDMFGTADKWYPLPIIEEARKLKELQPLCFPLNEKQLIIIKRILLGQDEKFFILTGVGGSGKSTFANIIKQIFNNDFAALTLEELGNDFKLATAINKRLVYADELNSDDINNGVIKTLVSKQAISVNPKYGKNFDAIFQSTLFFSCNRPPRLDLGDTGMIRRIVYYSMNKKIENPDPLMQKREYTHEDLVNIVAHALRVDTKDWEEKFKDETRQILKSNNSVWLCRDERHFEKTTYDEYCDKCKDKNLKPFSEPRWQEVKELLLSWDKEDKKDYEIDDKDLPF